jgi:hypothetical protein
MGTFIIILPHKVVRSIHIKTTRGMGYVAYAREMENEFKVSVRKPQQKRPLWRQR